MSLPTYQDYYPYILQNADYAKSADEYLEILSVQMKISDEELKIKNSSGEPTARNRLRWGIHYLRHAGLIDKPVRGQFVITARGKQLRKDNGLNITNKTLYQYEEFRKFKDRKEF